MNYLASILRRGLVAFVTLGALACSTHTVDACLPACDASDQTEFAQCVAAGTSECPAGNRRCCALAQACIGALDDQVVETTRTECDGLVAEQCERPCTAADLPGYELCVGMGDSSCAIGDEECCALAAHCLGTIAEYLVTADGCCGDASDCATGDVCDASWTCVAGPGCGDGVVGSGERCDDGNQYTEACTYGPTTCPFCTAECTSQPARYCGDGALDSLDGEECDPPVLDRCDDLCHAVASTCSNGRMDGEETDRDCGGPVCAPCAADAMCLTERDCERLLPECDSFVGCDGVCFEDVGCVPPGSCPGICTPGVGCSHDVADSDGDGFDCEIDCDDTDRMSNPSSPDLCGDFIDQNCDGTADEGC